MPMIWNAEAEAKLFASYLKTADAPKFNYEEMAMYMGPDCTAKAIQHRITHIKSIAKTLVPDGEAAAATNGNGNNAGATKAVKTPKSAKSSPTKASPTKKRGSDQVEGDNDLPASAKKPKSPKKAATSVPKGKKEEVDTKAAKGKKAEEVVKKEEVVKTKTETAEASGDVDAEAV